MLNTAPRSAFSATRAGSQASQFAGLLEGFYSELIEEGVPEHLATLVQQIDRKLARPAGERRLALVVEADPYVRGLAVALLGETDLRVIDCGSAEAAIEVVQSAADLAFVFTAEVLSGTVDGVELARLVKTMRPDARVVVTTEPGAPRRDLPDGTIRLPKPWRGPDVLMEAEKATGG